MNIVQFHTHTLRCFDILPEKKQRAADSIIQTPMPGTLISLSVKVGDVVFEGQEVAVVEAMKMQNQLHSPRSGKIKAVLHEQGATLDDGDIIVEFEEEPLSD